MSVALSVSSGFGVYNTLVAYRDHCSALALRVIYWPLVLSLSRHTYKFRVVTVTTRTTFLSPSHVAHLNLSISIRFTTGSTHLSSHLTNGSNSPGKAPYNRLSTHRFKRNRLVHLTISYVRLSHSRHTHTHTHIYH